MASIPAAASTACVVCAEVEAAGRADVARIRETGKVLRALADLDPNQLERLHGHLERVRPPPPDQLPPPAAS